MVMSPNITFIEPIEEEKIDDSSYSLEDEQIEFNEFYTWIKQDLETKGYTIDSETRNLDGNFIRSIVLKYSNEEGVKTVSTIGKKQKKIIETICDTELRARIHGVYDNLRKVDYAGGWFESLSESRLKPEAREVMLEVSDLLKKIFLTNTLDTTELNVFESLASIDKNNLDVARNYVSENIMLDSYLPKKLLVAQLRNPNDETFGIWISHLKKRDKKRVVNQWSKSFVKDSYRNEILESVRFNNWENALDKLDELNLFITYEKGPRYQNLAKWITTCSSYIKEVLLEKESHKISEVTAENLIQSINHLGVINDYIMHLPNARVFMLSHSNKEAKPQLDIIVQDENSVICAFRNELYTDESFKINYDISNNSPRQFMINPYMHKLVNLGNPEIKLSEGVK